MTQQRYGPTETERRRGEDAASANGERPGHRRQAAQLASVTTHHARPGERTGGQSVAGEAGMGWGVGGGEKHSCPLTPKAPVPPRSTAPGPTTQRAGEAQPSFPEPDPPPRGGRVRVGRPSDWPPVSLPSCSFFMGVLLLVCAGRWPPSREVGRDRPCPAQPISGRGGVGASPCLLGLRPHRPCRRLQARGQGRIRPIADGAAPAPSEKEPARMTAPAEEPTRRPVPDGERNAGEDGRSDCGNGNRPPTDRPGDEHPEPLTGQRRTTKRRRPSTKEPRCRWRPAAPGPGPGPGLTRSGEPR